MPLAAFTWTSLVVEGEVPAHWVGYFGCLRGDERKEMRRNGPYGAADVKGVVIFQ